MIMIKDIIKLDFTIFILLIPVELVWLVFGEQKRPMILLNINENYVLSKVSAVLGYLLNLVSS